MPEQVTAYIITLQKPCGPTGQY